MVKVVTIIEDNIITGVKYGTVEIPETVVGIQHASRLYNKAKLLRAKKIHTHRTRKK